ncbi:MAG: radical SAM protein [Deltaproteobacteria bacterium]|nr:radical SAM protein [Deltaproteobacteria bacterium]
MIPHKNIRRLIAKASQQPAYALRAARMRLLSSLSYRFLDGRSAPPETISLLLTYRCNLHCKMCGQWGERGSLKGLPSTVTRRYLELPLIEDLIKEVKSFHPTITLFGGEPLLHPQWGEVVKRIKEVGLRCNMISNGILLKKKAEEAVQLGLDEIIFSLDGPAEVHDVIRGGKGVFRRALEGFQHLQAAKERYGKKRPAVNVNTVIWEENHTMLDDIVDEAAQFGAQSITFHHLIFVNQGAFAETERITQAALACNSPDWAGFITDELPRIDPERIIEQRRKIEGGKNTVPAFFYPNFTDEEIRTYYNSFDFFPTSYKRRCLSPWMVAYVLPDGMVKPCLSLGYVVGNLLETPFKEIWNGERAVRFRRLLKERGHFPVCPRCTEFSRF